MDRGWLAVLGALCTGCATVDIYHPLSALERPYAIDLSKTNFDGLHVAVTCVEGGALTGSAAAVLCRKVGAALEAQGASLVSPGSQKGEEALEVEIRARVTEEGDNLWALPLVALSFTIFPLVTEQTVEQTIQVRDAWGFLLAEEKLPSRFIHYWGAAYWGLNAALNFTLRRKGEELDDETLKARFSQDVFGHLSQVLFNASLRSQALRLASEGKEASR